MSTSTASISHDESTRRYQVISARERLIQSFLNGEIDMRTFKNGFNLSLQTESHIRRIRGYRSTDVFNEEIQRLNLAEGCSRINIAAAAARRRREESALRYSRNCPICLSDCPRQLSAFSACGHLVCRACAEQLAMDSSCPACPFCRQQSRTVALIEDPAKDSGDDFIKRNREEKKRVLMETALRQAILRNQEFSAEHRDFVTLLFVNDEIDQKTYLGMYTTSLKCEALQRETAGGRFEDVAELPSGAINRVLAFSSIRVAYRREKVQFIKHLRSEDEKITPDTVFSRACLTCHSPSPPHRSLFTGCGHVVCRACAAHSTSCPHCHKESNSVDLFEDLIETENI